MENEKQRDMNEIYTKLYALVTKKEDEYKSGMISDILNIALVVNGIRTGAIVDLRGITPEILDLLKKAQEKYHFFYHEYDLFNRADAGYIFFNSEDVSLQNKFHDLFIEKKFPQPKNGNIVKEQNWREIIHSWTGQLLGYVSPGNVWNNRSRTFGGNILILFSLHNKDFFDTIHIFPQKLYDKDVEKFKGVASQIIKGIQDLNLQLPDDFHIHYMEPIIHEPNPAPIIMGGKRKTKKKRYSSKRI